MPAYALTDICVAYATASGKVEIAAGMSKAVDRQCLSHNFNSSGLGLAASGARRMSILTVSVRN